MNRTSNYQDILKTLATLAMIIDHIGFYFFPEILILRSIGRYAFPIFCFFAGFNYKGNLNYKILIYGIILYIFQTFVMFCQISTANILISIFLGQIYLKLFETHFTNFYKTYAHALILGCLWPLTDMYIEYGTLSIALMALGKSAKQEPKNVYISAFLVAYLSFSYTIDIFYPYFNITDTIVASLVTFGLFISLISNNYFKPNKLKLVLISKNVLNIYCLHLAIILLIWRYYILA